MKKRTLLSGLVLALICLPLTLSAKKYDNSVSSFEVNQNNESIGNDFLETLDDSTEEGETYLGDPYISFQIEKYNVSDKSRNLLIKISQLQLKYEWDSKNKVYKDPKAVDNTDILFNNFIGYYGSDNYKPAKLTFNVSDKNNNKHNYSVELPESKGVGSYLSGKQNEKNYYNVELPYDCVIDIDSIKITNIFKANVSTSSTGANVVTPILDNPLTYDVSKSDKNYSTYNVNDFVDFTFTSFAEYSNFLSIKIKVDNKSSEIYQNLFPDYYKTYKNAINNGTAYIRAAFIGPNGYLKVTTNNNEIIKIPFSGNSDKDINSYSSYVYFKEETHTIEFLLKGYTHNDIYNVELCDMTLSLGVYNLNTSKIVTATLVELGRFGTISTKMNDILNYDNTVGLSKLDVFVYVNYNLIILISLISFTVLYIVLALTYYFFLKKKDKNSEFKVLNKSNFIKNGCIGFVFLGFALVDALYISFRSIGFKNSLTVYNPLDWVIIVASVVVICLGGYFIKYFYTAIKNRREKIAREKLNLNADSADDGTN